MQVIYQIDTPELKFDAQSQQKATQALESGCVLYLPNLPFELKSSEEKFLTPDLLAPKAKNVSYQPQLDKVKGSRENDSDLDGLMKRYFKFGQDVVTELLPHYASTIKVGNTSFRPAEVKGRSSSYRKDDTRLHVDAFPSNPNQGKRILRVFSNVNPNGQSRHWRLGEPFESVMRRFLSKSPSPLPFSHHILYAAGITKSLRTDYDHYMLQMHNRMKADMGYQASAEQIEFFFPPGATWLVYTDCVSHAAMGGQFVMEQTFALPVEGMLDPEKSPLRMLEKEMGQKLVAA